MKWTAVLAAAAVLTLTACGARPLSELEDVQGTVSETSVPEEEKAKTPSIRSKKTLSSKPCFLTMFASAV